MALAPRQRRLVLGGALVVTLALVIWVGQEPEEPAPRARAPAEPRAGARAPGSQGERSAATPAPVQPGSLGLNRGGPAMEKREIRDIFAAQTWHVEPPPTPAAAAVPQAPPLPFTYLGKLIDRGQVTVYLASGEDRNLAVRQGDVIDGVYRVRRITPNAVTFVYIPMNKQQTLEIGRTN